MNEETMQELQENESAQTTEISSDETTVSGNDIDSENIQSVSQGDAPILEDNSTYTETETYTNVPYDDTILLQKIDTIVNTNICIIFIILFVWVEYRIRNAVWRYFGHGKSN